MHSPTQAGKEDYFAKSFAMRHAYHYKLFRGLVDAIPPLPSRRHTLFEFTNNDFFGQDSTSHRCR